MNFIRCVLLTTVFATALPRAWAQYYDWGQDPASIKWERTKTPSGDFVFPRTYRKNASRLINYMDTVRPWVSYGFSYGPMKLPLVVHSQNFSSNGLVLMAPKRMEFIVTPPAGMAAMPWLKQLAVHEYRHSVQYNNLDRGLIRVLSRVIGQQGSMIGAGLLPYWFLEGDAVLAETQMSSYGRGLQPSFTIDYRMFCLEGLDFSEDQYFSGSFRHPMPSQYELGYQIVSYADTKYGHNIWNKVARYASRNPYVLFTNYFGLRKYYDTTPGRLYREAFDDLWSYWRSQEEAGNSAELIPTRIRTYTTYTSPVAMPDGRIAAFKSDLQRPSRIVSVDTSSGEERLLARTGNVSSPMTVGGGRIYWTEYRQSTFWQQRVNSQLCYFDIADGRKGIVKEERRVTYPVAMEDGSYAAVEYDYDGTYSIKHGEWRVAMPDTLSVHGLAYDDLSQAFYFIGLSDAGMWIGTLSKGSGMRAVTRPNRSSIANLRAGRGKLYYNSIATGKDEAHMYDLAEGKEYAISHSKYGSFSPSPLGAGVAQTTFTKDGYRLALQDAESTRRQVEWSELPLNTVNPPRRKWDVMNIDRVMVADTTIYKPRKYRRGLNLVQIHSWAPFYFDPEELVSEADFSFGVGATLLSQNLLNSTFSQLGYKYTKEGHLVRGKINYYGWAPKFELKAEWSSMDQLDYRAFIFAQAEDADYRPRDYFGIEGRVYLPLLLSNGYHNRRLTPQVAWEYNNGRVISKGIAVDNGVPVLDGDRLTFRNGFNKLTASLQYTDNVRLAYRDFLPRWGYTARVSASGNPLSDMYGNLVSAFGRVYLPGVAPQHSLMLRATTQKVVGEGLYGFKSKELFPRGADYNRINPRTFSAFAIDYQMPVWYPDGGIPGVLYVTRVRLNLGFDMAFCKTPALVPGGTVVRDLKERIWSYGVDVTLDMIPLSMPFNTQGTLGVSIYKPSNSNGVSVGVGVSLPL